MDSTVNLDTYKFHPYSQEYADACEFKDDHIPYIKYAAVRNYYSIHYCLTNVAGTYGDGSPCFYIPEEWSLANFEEYSSPYVCELVYEHFMNKISINKPFLKIDNQKEFCFGSSFVDQFISYYTGISDILVEDMIEYLEKEYSGSIFETALYAPVSSNKPKISLNIGRYFSSYETPHFLEGRSVPDIYEHTSEYPTTLWTTNPSRENRLTAAQELRSSLHEDAQDKGYENQIVWGIQKDSKSNNVLKAFSFSWVVSSDRVNQYGVIDDNGPFIKQNDFYSYNVIVDGAPVCLYEGKNVFNVLERSAFSERSVFDNFIKEHFVNDYPLSYYIF